MNNALQNFLTPGAQKTKNAGGLLPACGIELRADRLQAKSVVMPTPMLMAAGVQVPSRNAENWAPVLSKAKFDVAANRAIRLNCVVFFNKRLKNGAPGVYEKV
jgi:hypothetical protein